MNTTIPNEVIKKLLAAPTQQGSTPTELYVEIKQGNNVWQLWREQVFDDSLVLTRWYKGHGYDYIVPEELLVLEVKLKT